MRDTGVMNTGTPPRAADGARLGTALTRRAVINAGAERVKELGGVADEPRPVPSMGWFAICRDTEGNEFGLWQTDPSAPGPAE